MSAKHRSGSTGHPSFRTLHGQPPALGSIRSHTVLASGSRRAPRKSRSLHAAAFASVAVVAASLVVGASASAETPYSLRLAAGGTASYTDPAGQVWSADRYFAGGSVHGSNNAIAGTTADTVYQKHRWGMTGYALPVDCSGIYAVTMHFAETVMTQRGKRVFSVSAEGVSKMSKLDVFNAAGGANKALQKNFKVTVKDGNLNIGFGRIVEDPMVSGIEVKRSTSCTTSTPTASSTPTTSGTPTSAPTSSAPAPTSSAPAPTSSAPAAPPFAERINAASNTDYVDPNGKTYSADEGFVGGYALQGGDVEVGGTQADPLYRKHRWGMTGYRVAVPNPGTYRVTLHTAELIFDQAGQRVFDVTAEGATKIDDLDVVKVAGPDRALTTSFDVNVTDGMLNLGFSATQDDPMVSGIEVLSVGTDGGSAPPTTAPPTTSTPTPPSTSTPTANPTTTAPPTPAPAPAPGGGTRPTEANTGPRVALGSATAAEVLASRSCQGKRVSGVLRIERGVSGTFNFTDCYFDQIVAESHLATLNLDHVQAGSVILNSWAPNPGPTFNAQWSHFFLQTGLVTSTGNLDWGAERRMPVTCTSCYLYERQGNPSNGDHTEALASWGWGDGYRFINSAFVQQGPMNGTATATINFHGVNSVFDGCWFAWENGVASYYTVYVEGRNNVVRNSYFEKGAGNYVYPDSSPQASYSGNKDIGTGQQIQLP